MKRTRTMLAVAILGFALTGCHKISENAPPPAAPGTNKPTVALVMKSLANEFFATMQSGAEAHQKAHAGEYALLANGIKDEQDVAAQQRLVEQMTGERVSALVIAPADSKSMVSVCKKAIDAGIPVVNIDNKFDAGVLADNKARIPFVGPDNRKGARLAGEYLAKRLTPGDKVAIIEGAPNAFNGQQRKAGFEDAMNAAGMKVVASQTGRWETNQANQVASAMLTSRPDLKAILCANDSMALGAVAALQAAGKTGKILVVGFDNISAAQQLLKDGKMLCTVDQHGDQLAVYGIQYALDLIAKKAPPQDKETPVDLITADTLK